MPKLDGTTLPEHLRRRLQELRDGKEVAIRDIRALLTDEQQAAMNAAWLDQQALRKTKKARTAEERAVLGWKEKRDVYIEAIEAALEKAREEVLPATEDRLKKAEVRRATIYMDAYFAAVDQGKDKYSAASAGNNALTRAGLQRLDRQPVSRTSVRDLELRDLEREILERLPRNLNLEDQETLEWLKNQNKNTKSTKKSS